MKKILILGGVSYDTIIHIPHLPTPRPQNLYASQHFETIGSTGAGKALNLQRVGFDVTFHALIGDDDYGTQIRTVMTQEGISFLYDIDPQGTERHVNLMDPHGGRISIYVQSATFEPEVDWSKIEPVVAACDVVVLNIINYCREAIPLIQRHNKPMWCDIHDYDGRNPYHADFITAADVIQMSSDALLDYRPLMEQWIAAGKVLVVCTHGKDGATALTAAGEWHYIDVAKVDAVVDTNGAGDSFFSGVLFGHLQGYDIAQALRLGALNSALCVSSTELAHPDLTKEMLLQQLNGR